MKLPTGVEVVYWILMPISFLISVAMIVKGEAGYRRFGRKYLVILFGMCVFTLGLIISYIVLKAMKPKKKKTSTPTPYRGDKNKDSKPKSS